MNNKPLKQTEIITVYLDTTLSTKNTVNFNLDLDFSPEYMIIKQVSIHDNSIDILNSPIIVVLYASFYQKPIYTWASLESQTNGGLDIYHKLNGKNINGNHSFSIFETDMTIPDLTTKYALSLIIEFGKY
jgi:hypothetical protein